MEEAGINISGYAESMLRSREFTPGKNQEEATIIRLTVADLGFRTIATTNQIYERAHALGLDLCPPDTGPELCLKYRNQPLGEWLYIGMKQIAGSGGGPSVFGLVRSDGGLWLDGGWAEPSDGWNPSSEFALRLRPPAERAGKSES